MQVLVTSAKLPSGAGYGAVLSFDLRRQTVDTFAKDFRIIDPRGLAVSRHDGLVFINAGPDRIVAVDPKGAVVQDTGILPGFDVGGANFDEDGQYCFTARALGTIGTIGKITTSLADVSPKLRLPAKTVPFPRGFSFSRSATYLASGVGPDGAGENTIHRFTARGAKDTGFAVHDPQLSPLDMSLAPTGTLLVSSEWPFGSADATTTIREYDADHGHLLRIFQPSKDIEFEKPRGLRFGPDGHLYCTAKDGVVSFDFVSGLCLGSVARLPGLNGQALVFFPEGV